MQKEKKFFCLDFIEKKIENAEKKRSKINFKKKFFFFLKLRVCLRKRLWGENERVKKKQKSFLFRVFDFSVVFLFSVFFSFLSASLKLEMERKPVENENSDRK